MDMGKVNEKAECQLVWWVGYPIDVIKMSDGISKVEINRPE